MINDKLLNGFYVTLEGGEGCGKTTILKKLKYLCDEKNFVTILNTLSSKFSKSKYRIINENLTDSLFVKEPGATPFADALREIAVNMKLETWKEVELFALARTSLYKERVYPALEESKLVISDRGIDSSIVYQGIVENYGILNTMTVNKAMIGKHYHQFRFPDCTVILDLPPEVGLERIRKNNRETNKFEENDISFHETVRAGFKYLTTGCFSDVRSSRFSVVDARPDEDIVFRHVVYTIIHQFVFLTSGTYLDIAEMNDLFKETFSIYFDDYTDIGLSSSELDEWLGIRN